MSATHYEPHEYRQKCLDAKEEVCENCGDVENVVVHHIDNDRSNDSLENLVPLCRSCHALVHTASEKGSDYLLELASELPDAGPFKGEAGGYTQRTIAADDKTKELVEAAQDELSSELGVSVTQKDTVAKLAKRYLKERGSA